MTARFEVRRTALQTARTRTQAYSGQHWKDRTRPLPFFKHARNIHGSFEPKRPPSDAVVGSNTAMSKPRYLTASKISLLVLVQLYCDSGFPSSATVPVLSFVLSHTFATTPLAARKPHTVEQHVAPLSIRTFEDILQNHTSSMPGRSLLDDLLKCLWNMNSIDSLFDLFNDLGSLLGPSKEEPSQETKRMHLSPTSPLGALVRQARLEFTRLPFDDIVHLWCAFIAYRAPTAQWARRLSGLASSSVDIVATDLGLSKGDSLFDITYGHLLEGDTSSTSLSHDDLERILEFQLDKLQRMYTFLKLSSLTNRR